MTVLDRFLEQIRSDIFDRANEAGNPTSAPVMVRAGTVASTSTAGPTDSTHGARMNTARTGPPERPPNSRSVSKEST